MKAGDAAHESHCLLLPLQLSGAQEAAVKLHPLQTGQIYRAAAVPYSAAGDGLEPSATKSPLTFPADITSSSCLSCAAILPHLSWSSQDSAHGLEAILGLKAVAVGI